MTMTVTTTQKIILDIDHPIAPPVSSVNLEIIPIIGDDFTLYAVFGRLLIEFKCGDGDLNIMDITDAFKKLIHDEVLHGQIVPWALQKAKAIKK